MDQTDQVQLEENQGVNNFENKFEPKVGAVTKLFIKLKLAKDQQSANKAMLIISVFSLLLMAYFLISTYSPNLISFSK